MPHLQFTDFVLRVEYFAVFRLQNQSKKKKKKKEKSDADWQTEPSCDVCDFWIQEICNLHSNPNNIKWGNCDSRKWPTDSWEVAKAFMGKLHEPNKRNSASMYDISPILYFLKQCEFFYKQSGGKIKISTGFQSQNQVEQVLEKVPHWALFVFEFVYCQNHCTYMYIPVIT